MTLDSVAELVRVCLWTAFWVGLPVLTISFLSGAVMSIVQVLTSMQDSAFNTIPRLIAFFVGMLVFLPWMLERMITYTVSILGHLEKFAR
jgi:flagellar biosynthetic protein FliQ